MKTTRAILAIMLFSSIGCGPYSDCPPLGSETPANVIVICDLSLSVVASEIKDSACRSKMLEDIAGSCENIIRHYPSGSTIRFMIVSSNVYESHFFKLDVEDSKTKPRWKTNEEYRYYDTLIRKSLIQTTSDPDNSCILSTIQAAIGRIEEMQKDAKCPMINEIVILSDMLEDCKSSPAGNVKMVANKNGSVLSNADRIEFSEYTPDEDYSDVDVTVRVCNISCDMNSSAAKELKLLWRPVFAKLGVDSTELSFSSPGGISRRAIFD